VCARLECTLPIGEFRYLSDEVKDGRTDVSGLRNFRKATDKECGEYLSLKWLVSKFTD
jgi:hypothetical protein